MILQVSVDFIKHIITGDGPGFMNITCKQAFGMAFQNRVETQKTRRSVSQSLFIARQIIHGPHYVVRKIANNIFIGKLNQASDL